MPNKEEFDFGFWGRKYYLQDNNSLNEMEFYLKKMKIPISLEVVSKDMLRMGIEKNIINFKTLRKDCTIFTHDTYWDLIACLLAIFNPFNDNCLKLRNKLKNKVVFIRLHPSLNKNKALYIIKRIIEIPNIIRFEFIDNKKESIIESMRYSRYNVFGISPYVNIALETNCKVISIDTNHINKSPIRYDFRNASNLFKASPW